MAVIPPPTPPKRREAPERPALEVSPSTVPEVPHFRETVNVSLKETTKKTSPIATSPPPSKHAPLTPPVSTQSRPLTRKLEALLAQNILPLYGAMEPEAKAKFRSKGKEILATIEQMVASGRVVVARVFDLIRSWLVIIPGINKYFLEQEAKIKTDRIVALTRDGK